jgi:hypothetical protein
MARHDRDMRNPPAPRRTITPSLLGRLAGIDRRTAGRWLAGLPVMPGNDLRLLAAAKSLTAAGYVRPELRVIEGSKE